MPQLGSGGLTGRTPVRPPPEPLSEEERVEAEPGGVAMPSGCLRVLHARNPESVGGCPIDCPGRQQDGSCGAELVRAAIEAGVPWAFELDRDNNWVFVS